MKLPFTIRGYIHFGNPQDTVTAGASGDAMFTSPPAELLDNPIWGFAGKYGGNVTGGETPYLVNTLEDSVASPQPGMLRHALLNASQNVCFVEGMSGNIELDGELAIPADTTIDACTNSIRITGHRIWLNHDNVILRNLGLYNTGANSQASNQDSVGVIANRILIDRCSIGWSVDECVDIIGSGCTIQRSVIAWPLAMLHPNPPHALAGRFESRDNGYGGISAMKNLFALCSWRPTILGDVNLDGNVFYGYGNVFTTGEGYSYPCNVEQSPILGQTRVDLRNNVYVQGPAANGVERTIRFNDSFGTNISHWRTGNVWRPLSGPDRDVSPIFRPGVSTVQNPVAHFLSIQSDAPEYDLFDPVAHAGPLNPDNFVLAVRAHYAARTGNVISNSPTESIPGGVAGL